jgi:predicted NBD/HSP70 family sugar kinase
VTKHDVGQSVRTPSLATLREATDTRVLTEVIGRGRTTRAELSAVTGISKPTVSEAVRRLVAGGLLDETGRAETGRPGRTGTLYELATASGWVLAIQVDQAGVKAWSADLAGRILHRHEQPVGVGGSTEALSVALRAIAEQATAAVGARPGPLRTAAVSVANPVDPSTHEVIALPGSPFPEGVLSPADVLAGVLEAPVLVDNDVNLAALAEYRTGAAVGVVSFAYLYVGAGLGLGLYVGDRMIRGAHGLAGEIGYLPGGGTSDGLRTLDAELGAAGLGRSDAPSTDVGAVRRLLDRPDDPAAEQALQVLSLALARTVASVNAVVDPELILLGGPVGSHPALLEPVRSALAAITVGPDRLAYGTLGALGPLHGAIQRALEHARAAAIAVPAG